MLCFRERKKEINYSFYEFILVFRKKQQQQQLILRTK
jgi:hypothetical protein